MKNEEGVLDTGEVWSSLMVITWDKVEDEVEAFVLSDSFRGEDGRWDEESFIFMTNVLFAVFLEEEFTEEDLRFLLGFWIVTSSWLVKFDWVEVKDSLSSMTMASLTIIFFFWEFDFDFRWRFLLFFVGVVGEDDKYLDVGEPIFIKL